MQELWYGSLFALILYHVYLSYSKSLILKHWQAYIVDPKMSRLIHGVLCGQIFALYGAVTNVAQLQQRSQNSYTKNIHVSRK